MRISHVMHDIVAVVFAAALASCSGPTDTPPPQRAETPATPASPIVQEQPADALVETHPMYTVEEALKLVADLGGKTRSSERDRDNVIGEVYLRGSRISDHQLPILGAFHDLRVLDLAETGVSDDGLKSIGRFSHLVGLGLAGTKISGKGLRELRHLKDLRGLDLTGTQVKESDLVQLRGCPRLSAIPPFSENTVAAWLMPGDLAGTAWVASKDGVLSMRILAPKKEISVQDPIVVLSEFRNDGTKPIRIVYPWEGRYGFQVIGPSGELRFTGVIACILVAPGSGSYPQLEPGDVIRCRWEMTTADYKGSDQPGSYRLQGMSYVVDANAERLGALPGFDFTGLWSGQITPPPITVTKIR